MKMYKGKAGLPIKEYRVAITILTILAIILFIAVMGYVGRQDIEFEQAQEQSFIEGNR
jgi:hypothetical protein